MKQDTARLSDMTNDMKIHKQSSLKNKLMTQQDVF